MTDDAHDRGTGRDLAPETLAAQALGRIDEVTRALVPAVHPSTTYERDPDGGYRSGRGYTRPHNPTYDEPEALLATLEGGSDCLLFASGMAAATAVFQSLLPGDHVVAPRVMYWALRTWLVKRLSILTPDRRAKLTPLSGTAEVVPVVNRGTRAASCSALRYAERSRAGGTC